MVGKGLIPVHVHPYRDTEGVKKVDVRVAGTERPVYGDLSRRDGGGASIAHHKGHSESWAQLGDIHKLPDLRGTKCVGNLLRAYKAARVCRVKEIRIIMAWKLLEVSKHVHTNKLPQQEWSNLEGGLGINDACMG